MTIIMIPPGFVIKTQSQTPGKVATIFDAKGTVFLQSGRRFCNIGFISEFGSKHGGGYYMVYMGSYSNIDKDFFDLLKDCVTILTKQEENEDS